MIYMKKNAIFTIVAKNYIGLAQILGKSVKKHHSDVDFFIFVADETNQLDIKQIDGILFAKHILMYNESEWIDMSFKYDITEFCTSIKPACFQYFISCKYEKIVYLDPDVFVFSSMQPIFDILDKYDMALTPQICGIHKFYNGEHPEWAMNVNGIFNLGFCAVKNSVLIQNVVEWWRIRLVDNCFADRSAGNFTDQKWMDWMPAILGNNHLFVCSHLGMNVAPWNFFEREIFKKESKLYVRYRDKNDVKGEVPLIFFHFAGYDYSKLINGIIHRKRLENLSNYPDMMLAINIYKDALVENKDLFNCYLKERYSYGNFNNGDRIDRFHRRLYHGYCKQYGYIDNPFSTSRGSFYDLIKKNGMVGNGNVDTLSKNNLPSLKRKRSYIAFLFRFLYNIIGYKRYVLFVKSLYDYCRPEWHVFLIKNKL